MYSYGNHVTAVADDERIYPIYIAILHINRFEQYQDYSVKFLLITTRYVYYKQDKYCNQKQ